jgi:3-deoxy-D-manno-octulosonic-acid transferase
MPGVIAGAWAAGATAASPALRLMLHRRATRGKEIAARLPERYGIDPTPRPPGRLLWLHAASVGETISALPLLGHLPRGITTLFTTGTVTSAGLLAGRLADLPGVMHRFVPLDVPAWAARFLDHWRPDAAAFLESELWPNLLAACGRRRIPVALVNARLSARSAAAWARLPGFAGAVLANLAWIDAQSEPDAARFRALGGRQVACSGNLKWVAPALSADAADLARLSQALGARPRWLAASTHPADDALVADVHRALARRHPGLLTAIAPRHPERGAALARAFAEFGAAPRRALGEDPRPDASVWIADTLGELGLLYRTFPVVYLGKGFAGGGGQNPFEPARLGCAIATGPDTQNFADMIERLRSADALHVVTEAKALVDWVDRMLSDQDAVDKAGAAARSVASDSGDLPARLAARLAALAGVAPE